MIIFRGRDIRFCLDRSGGQLWRGQEGSGEPIHLPPKQWELLRYLAENPKRLISKKELVAKIWGVDWVTDDAFSRVVMGLRRALGDDDPDHPLFIQNIHGRGFRFVAEIESSEQTLPDGDQTPSEQLGAGPAAQPVEEQPSMPDTTALSQEDDVLEVEFKYRVPDGGLTWHRGRYTSSWNHLFAVMGPYMLSPSQIWSAEAQLRVEIIGCLNKGEIEDYDFHLLEETRNQIKVQFMALGLVEPGPKENGHETWKLTPFGVKKLIASQAARRKVD